MITERTRVTTNYLIFILWMDLSCVCNELQFYMRFWYGKKILQ